ncbi:conserved domain protein [delta proteobacterium NaphS2]|nr:conserved domain protein [delta proteobacterium NaphS2]
MIDVGNGLFLPEDSPASPEILATLTGRRSETENPMVVSVVKRFKSSTEKLKSLKRLHDQEQKMAPEFLRLF